MAAAPKKATRTGAGTAGRTRKAAPAPLLSSRPKRPVDWLFLFKFNAAEDPGDPAALGDHGIFDAQGIKKPSYDEDGKAFSQHYLHASSSNPKLAFETSRSALGVSKNDPLGATFAQVYFAKKAPYFVIWNDQFYNDPLETAFSPWGHSKGMLVWNDDGEGFVLQVSTPSWPGAGNIAHPRQTDGNTLGFVRDDDVEVSQHFFSLALDKNGVLDVLAGLHTASVRTDPTNPQIVNNGGPAPIRTLVTHLGQQSETVDVVDVTMSSGARLIAKPSALHVAPWQLVSAQLGGVDLRVASWWEQPEIPSTTRKSALPKCWPDSLAKMKPGAVQIATTGTWPIGAKTPNLGLVGGLGNQYNHAKIGVSTSGTTPLSIFGDMNQQGSLGDGKVPCSASQNGRGGLFFVMSDPDLHDDLTGLLRGASAPVK